MLDVKFEGLEQNTPGIYGYLAERGQLEEKLASLESYALRFKRSPYTFISFFTEQVGKLSVQSYLTLNLSFRKRALAAQITQSAAELMQLPSSSLKAPLTSLSLYQSIQVQLLHAAHTSQPIILTDQVLSCLSLSQRQQLLPQLKKISCTYQLPIYLFTEDIQLYRSPYIDRRW